MTQIEMMEAQIGLQKQAMAATRYEPILKTFVVTRRIGSGQEKLKVEGDEIGLDQGHLGIKRRGSLVLLLNASEWLSAKEDNP